MSKHGSAALGIGLGAVILYLGAHALTGRQGLVAYIDLQGREQALQAQLDELAAERTALEARADRMRAESLDLDYLDERARILLGAGDAEHAELAFALNP